MENLVWRQSILKPKRKVHEVTATCTAEFVNVDKRA